jgi:hypothetical protein
MRGSLRSACASAERPRGWEIWRPRTLKDDLEQAFFDKIPDLPKPKPRSAAAVEAAMLSVRRRPCTRTSFRLPSTRNGQGSACPAWGNALVPREIIGMSWPAIARDAGRRTEHDHANLPRRRTFSPESARFLMRTATSSSSSKTSTSRSDGFSSTSMRGWRSMKSHCGCHMRRSELNRGSDTNEAREVVAVVDGFLSGIGLAEAFRIGVRAIRRSEEEI